MDSKFNYTRLPLPNAKNVRDLGGYGSDLGVGTKWHVFLRADDLSQLTEEEQEFLMDYGVKTIIDLRSSEEVADKPNVFASSDRIRYIPIPLLHEEDGRSPFPEDYDDFTFDKMYIGVIDNCPTNVARVFKSIGENIAGGGLLFHCTAGKDRTGVIAALLLDLVGVRREDIITNYEISHSNIKSIIDKIKYVSPEIPLTVFNSMPVNIDIFLTHLHSRYGGALAYLRYIGVSDLHIHAVMDAFLEV